MREHHAAETGGADPSWPATIDAGERAQEPQVLDQHPADGEDCGGTDGGCHADTLDGACDDTPGFRIERGQQLAIG